MAAHQCVGVGVGDFILLLDGFGYCKRAALVPQGPRSNGGSCDKHYFPCPVGGDTVYLLLLFSPHGRIELMDHVLWCSELKKTRGAIKHQHGNVFNSSWCWGYYIKAENTTEGVRTYNPIQYDGISFAKLRYNWLRVLMRPDLGPNTFGTFVSLVSGRLQATATKLNWAMQAVVLCRYALQFWMHTSEPLNTCWCTVTSAATTCLRSFVDIFVNSKADHPKHTNMCIRN